MSSQTVNRNLREVSAALRAAALRRIHLRQVRLAERRQRIAESDEALLRRIGTLRSEQ